MRPQRLVRNVLLFALFVSPQCLPSARLARAEAAPVAVAPDSIRAQDLIQTKDLARLLALPANRRPALLHVGFKVLYRGGHIPGSRYVGPASKPEGLRAMREALRPLPRQNAVVLYCGCCPWQDCPNVRPAIQAARAMGFKNVRVLFIGKNLQNDWIDKGLPIRQGE